MDWSFSFPDESVAFSLVCGDFGINIVIVDQLQYACENGLYTTQNKENRYEKILAFFLGVTFFVTMLAFPLHAANENSLSRTDAEETILEAYRRFGTLHNNLYWGHASSDTSKYWTSDDDVELMGPVSISHTETVEITDSVNGIPYTWTYSYCLETPYDPLETGEHGFLVFKSLDEVKAYGNAVFTNELTEKAMINTNADGRNTTVKTYLETEDGKLLAAFSGYGLFYNFDILGFGEYTSDSYEATMIVDLGVRGDTPYGPTWLHSTETVEFTKTADGWRVSGGTAFEVMLGEREPSPNTGDNTLPTAALLATIALAAVITPFAISKKRRVR